LHTTYIRQGKLEQICWLRLFHYICCNYKDSVCPKMW